MYELQLGNINMGIVSKKFFYSLIFILATRRDNLLQGSDLREHHF